MGALVSAHLFFKGDWVCFFFFFLCFFDVEFPLCHTEIPDGLQMRWNHRSPLEVMGPMMGPRPLFLLGHHNLTPERTQLLPPVACTHARGIDTPQGKHITTIQGQRKLSPVSGPNQAPSHRVPQGHRLKACRSGCGWG